MVLTLLKSQQSFYGNWSASEGLRPQTSTGALPWTPLPLAPLCLHKNASYATAFSRWEAWSPGPWIPLKSGPGRNVKSRAVCSFIASFSAGRLYCMMMSSARQNTLVLDWLVVLLVSCHMSSISPTQTSPDVISAGLLQRQRHRSRSGWTTTPKAMRRQPVPLDCSEGLQRCREDINCSILLETLDSVCDQSSKSPCIRLLSIITVADI